MKFSEFIFEDSDAEYQAAADAHARAAKREIQMPKGKLKAGDIVVHSYKKDWKKQGSSQYMISIYGKNGEWYSAYSSRYPVNQDITSMKNMNVATLASIDEFEEITQKYINTALKLLKSKGKI